MDFYERLEMIAESKGYKITNLCKIVTNSPGNISTWKKGYMRSDYLARCADILECSTDYILGRTNQPKPNETYINNGDVQAIKNGTISIDHHDDKLLSDFLNLFNSLDFESKIKVVNTAIALKNENAR